MNTVSPILHGAPAGDVGRSRVHAVVVTHNPKPDFEQNVRAIAPQVKQVIIVDNQSSTTVKEEIARIASAHHCETIWNQQNLGIATALNRGVTLALTDSSCQWILTLDQDSAVPPGFVMNMFKAYEACPFKEEVALVGANYQLAYRPLRAPGAAGTESGIFQEVKTLMTSGTLVKKSVFAHCGSFDESFFMDYVDHEFCFRVRRHGLRVIQANHAVLQHQLGSPTLHRILGRQFVTSNYSPNRRYHQARNRLIFYRRYFHSDGSWIAAEVVRWVREVVKMMIVEHDRKRKLASVVRGIWDGIRNSSARYEPGPDLMARRSSEAAREDQV
jgi:rhamnosyltransferase